MNVDKAIFLFAGTVNLVGLALMVTVHPLWILLPIFVDLNMIQASITGFCPAALILKKLGVKEGAAFKK